MHYLSYSLFDKSVYFSWKPLEGCGFSDIMKSYVSVSKWVKRYSDIKIVDDDISNRGSTPNNVYWFMNRCFAIVRKTRWKETHLEEGNFGSWFGQRSVLRMEHPFEHVLASVIPDVYQLHLIHPADRQISGKNASLISLLKTSLCTCLRKIKILLKCSTYVHPKVLLPSA